MKKRNYIPRNSVYRFGLKQAEYRAYLNNKYSEYSTYRALGYVQSVLVSNIVKDIAKEDVIYDVSNIDDLFKIARAVRNTKPDKRLHNVYSSAVIRYIGFVSSKK